MSAITDAVSQIQTFRDSKVVSPWVNFPRNVFADGLEARVRNADLIDTSSINLCGPGSFFRNMALDYTALYAKIGMELYDKGKTEFNGHKIEANQKLFNSSVSSAVAAVDWIMLATYQNSENIAWGFTSESDGFGGITLPGKLVDWFQSIGYKTTENSTNVFFTKGVSHLLAASNYYTHGYRVCLFINAQMLYTNSIYSSSFCPNHWVVLDSPVEVVMRSKVQFIEFDAWCWGKSRRIPATGYVSAENLTNNYYGFVAVRGS